METICQACGYQRRPTDQAPDWQCPSCGKAYAKTSHESPNHLSGHTDNSSSEPCNRLHGSPSYRKEPNESGLNKHWMVIGTLFAFLFFIGIPMLADPSSASAILLHSDAGFLAFIFAALMVTATQAWRMGASIDSNDLKSAFAFAATFYGLMLAILFFAFAISSHNEARTKTIIQSNGLRTMADVVRIYHGACGRRACSIYVEYSFTPSTGMAIASKPIHGYANLGDRSDNPRVTYARTNKQVPIAYDVGHPEVSALNFNDDVFRLDHNQRPGMALVAKIFLIAFALVLVIVALSLWLRPGKKSNVDGFH